MRRFLFYIALLVLSLVVFPAAAQVTQELYTLWDIPWDSTPEDCIRLANDNAGIVFSKSRYVDSDDLFTDKEQKIHMNGLEVESIMIAFNEDSKPDDFHIFFFHKPMQTEPDKENNESIIDNSISQFRVQYDALYTKYGDPTFTYIDIGTTSDTRTRYKVPMLGTSISCESISKIMQTNNFVSVLATWNNVCLGLTENIEENYMALSMAYFNVCIKSKDEELPSYTID